MCNQVMRMNLKIEVEIREKRLEKIEENIADLSKIYEVVQEMLNNFEKYTEEVSKICKKHDKWYEPEFKNIENQLKNIHNQLELALSYINTALKKYELEKTLTHYELEDLKRKSSQ